MDRAPVLGSGHPQADLFLLKYGPQTAEQHEGVAFFGRAGQAVLKSLQRLQVDPTAIYGTNCLKFVGADEEQAREWLAREIHVVQPKLIVVMGQDALTCLNASPLPARGGDREPTGVDPEVHSDDRRAGDPGPGRLAGRGSGEEGLLGGVQGDRALVVRTAAVLAVLAVLAWYYGFSEACPRSGSGATSSFSRSA